MANYIIRYVRTLPLGSGGGTLGKYRTLEEAKASMTNKDQHIYKIWYKKNSITGKWLSAKTEIIC